MSVESYAHKAAKATVVGWLSEARADMLDDIYACCLGTNWVTPMWWEEYPVLPDGTGMRPAWDGEIPTFEELQARQSPPSVIFDIAIAEYGLKHGIRTAIEIVHKNPPTRKKPAAVRDFGVQELLVLPARWVLGQVKRPKVVPEEFWVWR